MYNDQLNGCCPLIAYDVNMYAGKLKQQNENFNVLD